MARKDSRRKRKPSRSSSDLPQLSHGESLLAALRWVIQDGIFNHLKLHGNTSWLPADLVMLTVMWVWSESTTLSGAFKEARHWSEKVLKRVALTTYQGLMEALVSNSAQLLPCLWDRLHQLMQQLQHPEDRVGLWLALAGDGSRVSVPRTKDNEADFSLRITAAAERPSTAASNERSRLVCARARKNLSRSNRKSGSP